MTVKEAFELSAGWVFIELAKKIGKKRYTDYLRLCGYGNLNFTEPGTDFWNFGAFAISPVNQVDFLMKVYKGQLPFSKRNIEGLPENRGSSWNIETKLKRQLKSDISPTDEGRKHLYDPVFRRLLSHSST